MRFTMLQDYRFCCVFPSLPRNRNLDRRNFDSGHPEVRDHRFQRLPTDPIYPRHRMQLGSRRLDS